MTARAAGLFFVLRREVWREKRKLPSDSREAGGRGANQKVLAEAHNAQMRNAEV